MASGTGDDARRERGSQSKTSSSWKEKVNGVPTSKGRNVALSLLQPGCDP